MTRERTVRSAFARLDSRLHRAMTFAYGGGSAGNSAIAAGYLTGGQESRQVATSPADGETSAYSSLSPGWPDATQLTASGYVPDPRADGYPAPRWLFYRFSRPGPSTRSRRSKSAS